MQAIVETLFDAAYLITVITIGILMIRRSKGNVQYTLFGWMAVVLGAAAPLLVGLFLKEADVIAVAQQILRVQLIGMPFVGIVLASTCIFQAIGNGAGAMILSAGRQGVIFAIVIFCASKLAGFSVVIASQPVSDFLTALVAVMILLQWKKKEFAK